LQSTLNRRQFAIGSAAIVSGGLIGGLAGSRLAQGRSVRFDRRLPIPPLIDAAKQGNPIELKVASGRHAFVKGKPTRSYGYSAPVLGPVIRLRRGDEVQMTVENALDIDTTVHWHGLLVSGDVDGGPASGHQVRRYMAPELQDRPAGLNRLVSSPSAP
jgi:blue copper oxidase